MQQSVEVDWVESFPPRVDRNYPGILKNRGDQSSISYIPRHLVSEALRYYPEQHYSLGPHETNSALHSPLSLGHKDIQYWTYRAGVQHLGYTSRDRDLSDAVKMLIITVARAYNEDTIAREIAREAVSVILFRSRHP